MARNIVIRPAQKEDTEQLKPLMIKYIVDFYQKPKPSDEALEQLILHLQEQSSSGIQFVAEEDGKLLGFATLYFTFSTLQVKKTSILNDLFISEEARGQKIGEKLFQHCVAYIRENGYAYMTWETAKDNYAAQSLYNKMGGHISDWLVYEIE